ncbi:MAG: cytochrome C biosynthesis protein [Dysgonamonadaceae bacterium]|nr:cytochrome C biosynthesis protein [Dysgonamonadaceae bacterium]
MEKYERIADATGRAGTLTVIDMKYAYFFLLIAGSAYLQSCLAECKNPDGQKLTVPAIYPDYTGTVFPANISAPNFIIQEDGERFQTEIGYDNHIKIRLVKNSPQVQIPLKDWDGLLSNARGKTIFFRITILKNGKWTRYADIENRVADSSIDEYLAYRLIYPGYELWNGMGIYQRQLSSYKETAIVENKSLGDKQCLNCHTFSKNSPETMMLHIRGKSGGTIIYRDKNLKKTDTKRPEFKNAGAYASWHPSGRYIAFSLNDVKQLFHIEGKKNIEVFDLASDLAVYDVENNTMITDRSLSGNQYLETFPNWSPDGKTLYYCRANEYVAGEPLDSIRYDLYKISFNPDSLTFGSPVCIYPASRQNKSVSFPRISPDGHYLMFTVSDYGNFSVWHPESDLCLLNLSSKEMRLMDEVNSNETESFHTWSSDGKWFVFSSKRLDGLWARPYFACFDSETGKAGKPFLLPQKDPLFYDTFTKTYNLPELITSPVTIGKDIISAFFR